MPWWAACWLCRSICICESGSVSWLLTTPVQQSLEPIIAGFPFLSQGTAMPIYAYKCGSCGHAKDVLQKMSDAPLTVCPQCGAEAFAKQLTAAGFQLKGSGWYATDFKGGGGAASATATATSTAAEPSSASTTGGGEASSSASATAATTSCGGSCACH